MTLLQILPLFPLYAWLGYMWRGHLNANKIETAKTKAFKLGLEHGIIQTKMAHIQFLTLSAPDCDALDTRYHVNCRVHLDYLRNL